MNILMIVTWYTPKGAPMVSDGVFHYEQAMELQRRGCNVALYFPFDGQQDHFTAEREWGLMTYRTGTGSNRTLRILRDFRRIWKEFRPDIMHAQVAGGAGYVAMGLSKLYRIPYLITEHNPLEMYDMKNPKVRKRVAQAYHHSKKNICVSPDAMEKMQKAFPGEQFEVIYNGTLNPEAVTLTGEKYTVEGRVNCCIIASFYNETVKGYQYLLPAIRKLKDKKYPIMLHIVGGGEYLGKYQDMAAELDIEDCCIFYGSCSREKVYSILSQMDFSISASVIESAGVSVQEAMLMGKPLVVTRSGGASSVATPEAAILVDRESVDALADGIAAMIHSYGNYRSDKIKAYAYENFEMGQVTERYLRLYRRILEQ